MGYHKRNNIYIKVSKEGERKKGLEGLFKETMTKDFPNLRKDLGIPVHEAKKATWCCSATWVSSHN